MKILRFEILGLNDREAVTAAELSSDLNILTGRNGAGKTNVLKLLWYIISGNIFLALKEVPFAKITLVTDLYEITVVRTSPVNCRIEYADSKHGRLLIEDEDADEELPPYSAEERANSLVQELGASVFFPTFRRIEGGFTLDADVQGRPSPARKNALEEGLQALSRRLTNESHVFVAAISTGDIVNLLLRRYTDLSEISNRSQEETSQQIISKIKEFKSEDTSEELDAANHLIDEIRNLVEEMENTRLQVMTPIEEVRAVVESLFQQTTIRFGARLRFGDAASAVNSTALSAGEKQMLSFICYNAFYRDTRANCILI